MGKNILKTLRAFVYRHHLDRDPDKWVIELGTDESDTLATHMFQTLTPPTGPHRMTRYCDFMTLLYFMETKIYLEITTFRRISIEWFKPELTFREKEDNGQK